MSEMKKWNVLMDEKGNMNMISTEEALYRYQCQLQRQSEQQAKTLKHLLRFDLVSDLENVNMSDYLEEFKPIRKDEVNGIDDLITFAEDEAKERGVTTPCLCWLELDGQKYNLADEFGCFTILNTEKVTVEDDFESDIYSDKGATPFGWAHPSITEFYGKEVKEPEDYDYCLKFTYQLRNSIRCDIDSSESFGWSSYDRDEEFDPKKCAGCDFYGICNSDPMVGHRHYYIKAIR